MTEAIRDQMRQLRERHAEKNAQNPRKRPRDDSSPVRGSDTENQFPSTPLPLSFTGNALVPRNVTSTVINYAKKQKLRGDQLTQVDTFLAVDHFPCMPPFFLASDITARSRYRTLKPSVMRNSMSAFLSLQNDLQKIIATKPAYTVSPELKVNLKAYVAPVLLSPKLPAYKGDEPVGLVLTSSRSTNGTDDIQEEVNASIVAAGLIDAAITVNAGDAGAAGTNGGDEEEGSAT
ncbi:hypothetical protein B0H14DRAFT_3718262 [Mycena olivaceomarginata]|nr:hypothetical protein B0H14DRAFT_3718262 [Mycena olivaceomarginata]